MVGLLQTKIKNFYNINNFFIIKLNRKSPPHADARVNYSGKHLRNEPHPLSLMTPATKDIDGDHDIASVKI